MIFQDLYDTLVELLQEETIADLKECGESVYRLFETILYNNDKLPSHELLMRAKGLTDYCNENIMQYHFSNVPVHWRRMLMDSGLVTVLIQLGSLDERVTEAQVQDIVGDLDTCCVISGSPGPDRRWISNLILDELQTWLTNQRSGTTKEPAYEKVARSSTKVTLTYPIQRLPEPPSFEWFLQHCNRDIPTPFIMPKGVIEHWPAFNEHPWGSMDYLLSVAADRIVPVEIGSQYTDADWGQKMMRFSDFIQHHIMKDDIAYLAQHDVFYQIPRLEKDIIVPDYCYIEPRLTELYRCRTNNQILKNAWFGPKGTISPLHQDPYHNLLAQVVGSKYIRLISPVNTSFVYPRDGLMSNTSQVDVENPNHAIYPRFKEVDYLECVLEEGEILYIPPKWWHYVRSLETSFSVSLWF